MSEHKATIVWERGDAVFTDNRYSRGHRWKFDGLEVPASSSPKVVPLPLSVTEAIDPEEAFTASLSSCHMLWFLSLAAKRQFVIDSYWDEAVATIGRNESGHIAVTRVTLHPDVRFSGDKLPTTEDILALHHEAHDKCFIAQSVKTDVRVEPVGIPA